MEAHVKQEQICAVNDHEALDGFDKEQEKKLRSRKCQGLTEADRWKKLYLTLFPDCEPNNIPSPCELSILGFSYE